MLVASRTLAVRPVICLTSTRPRCMTRFAFPDFEAYAEAIPSLQGRVKLASREQRDWSMEVVDAGGLVLVGGQSGAAAIYDGAYQAGVFGIYAPSAGSETTVNGQKVHDGMFALLPPGVELHVRSRAPGHYFGLDVPQLEMWQRMQREGIDVNAWDGKRPWVVQRPNAVVALAAATLDAVQRGGSPPPEAAGRGLRERLLQAVADALAAPVPRERSVQPVTRGRMVRRAIAVIDARIESGESLAGLPQILNVSQRSLNRAFVESLGMSAQAYVGMTRLHAMRRALRAARPGDTVTSLAARLNIWDCGRMAGEYLQLFGIGPSEELHRAVRTRS